MSPKEIHTVLVANRGEIAVRVIRTVRAMGLRSVAVYSDADAGARHVAEADVAYRLGPAPARDSYLSIPKLLAACHATGADAVHPGYGFLSENAEFAAALQADGIIFVGPPAHAIAVMGDKITAKNTVIAHGVPVVPGIARPDLGDGELLAAAEEVGYPVLVKPSAGGGGKGMRVVERPADLQAALDSARREARSAFGDDTLFLERFVSAPRHIEVQVLADGWGNVIHLGERECSLQRRHQKVIEEAPSPLLDAAARARIGEAACATARSVDYRGAGTVEFIVSAQAPDEFFFMEMNTRLQVEHPVTELVTGVDLVEWQLRIAAGEKLTLAQDEVRLSGHAIEARLYAEDPDHGFLPTGGRILDLVEPAGVRVDSGIVTGYVVGSDYDPMLAKVIAHAPSRGEALDRLDRGLRDTVLLGVGTNIGFLRHLLADERVRAGDLTTALLDGIAAERVPDPTPPTVLMAAAVHAWLAAGAEADPDDPWAAVDGWRLGEQAPFLVRLDAADGSRHVVWLSGRPQAASIRVDDDPPVSLGAHRSESGIVLVLDGLHHRFRVRVDAHDWWVHDGSGAHHLRRGRPPRLRGDVDTGSADILSPMPGAVTAVLVADGSEVVRGQPVLVVEAMKMEHTLTAGAAGVVSLVVTAGTQVTKDQVLARVVVDDAADTTVES